MSANVIKSRKFWAAVVAIVAICLKELAGVKVDETAVLGVVATAVAYILGIAIEDHGVKSGATVTITGGAPDDPAAQ